MRLLRVYLPQRSHVAGVTAGRVASYSLTLRATNLTARAKLSTMADTSSTEHSAAAAISSSVPTASNTGHSAATETSAKPPLIVQLVVRRDLLEAEGWGVGPLMSQTAHAAVAVLHETRNLPETQAYLADLKNMRKAVLQTADTESLERLSELLSSSVPPIPHYLWIEQPENMPTCLALAPNRRESKIKKVLDKTGCRLWKG